MVERNFPSTCRSKIVPCKWWWLLILQIHPDILFFLILKTLSLLSAECGFPLGGKNNFKQSRVSAITLDCSLWTRLRMRRKWQVYEIRGIEIESNCSLSPPKQEQGDIKWNTEETSSKQNKGKWLFVQCIIKPWNSLPQDVVDVVNLHEFKKEGKHSWKKKSSRTIKYKDITSGSGRRWNANLKTLGECSEEVSLCCFTFPQAYIYCWPLSGKGGCMGWILE